MLEEKVQKYLAEHYEVEEWEAKDVMENKGSFYLLLIWGIFEQKYFPGKNNNVFNKIKKMKNNFKIYDCYNDFSQIALSFYDTFKDDNRWQKLDIDILSNKKNDVFNNIRCKKREDLSEIEIIRFGLFIIYRYRNNIFHGMKEAINFNQYTKEIEDCVNLLIAYLKGVK